MKMRLNQTGSVALLPERRGGMSAIGALLRKAAALLELWRSRRRDRSIIRHLDDHMLRDIGLDRYTAERIGTRPFWKG